jgi:hypothetical protein
MNDASACSKLLDLRTLTGSQQRRWPGGQRYAFVAFEDFGRHTCPSVLTLRALRRVNDDSTTISKAVVQVAATLVVVVKNGCHERNASAVRASVACAR